MIAILVALCGIILVILFRLKYDVGDIEPQQPSENLSLQSHECNLPSGSSQKPVTLDQECQTFPQIIFEVNQVQDFLESSWTKGNVTPEAAVFFTSVLESIAQQITENTISASKARSGKVLDIEDVLQGTEGDIELKGLVLQARSAKLEPKD